MEDTRTARPGRFGTLPPQRRPINAAAATTIGCVGGISTGCAWYSSAQQAARREWPVTMVGAVSPAPRNAAMAGAALGPPKESLPA